LQANRAHWTLLQLDSHVLARAEALVGTGPMRTLDAVHLASALVFEVRYHNAISDREIER